MKLELSINYTVEDPENPEAEEIIAEIVAEESRGLGEAIRRRLGQAGVRNINLSLSETPEEA